MHSSCVDAEDGMPPPELRRRLGKWPGICATDFEPDAEKRGPVQGPITRSAEGSHPTMHWSLEFLAPLTQRMSSGPAPAVLR